MPFGVLFATCIGASVIASLAIYRIWWHSLAIVPGPKLWSLSRLPWLWHMIQGDLWKTLETLHAQYGDTIRIAPNEISTRRMSAWHDIYVARPLLLKDPHSQTPPLNGAHSLFTAEGKTHKRIRGVLAHAFSDKALRDQGIIIEYHAERFAARLRQELNQEPDNILDLNKYFGYVTFDTITDLCYGESTECLQTPGEHPWIQRFFLHAQHSTIRNSLRWYFPLDRILDMLFLGLTRTTRERNWALTAKKIDRRLTKGETRADLLTPVIGRIEVDSDAKQKGITRSEVLSYAMAVVIADSQLTTAALTSCTYLVCHHQRSCERLALEIRNAFQNEAQITVQSTQNLVYLEATLKETLRVHHPSPVSLPRVIPSDMGRNVGGYYIPGNSIVGVNLQNIQLSAEYWFEPLAFHPERWLPAAHPYHDSRFDADNKTAFMPFSIGTRNCIGEKLFYAQARVALARLLWNFDVVLAEPDPGIWLNHRVYIVLEPKRLNVRLKGRSL